MKQRKTRLVKIGQVKIGAGNPIVVQSMTKTKTSDTTATIRQIKKLERTGCQIVRVAVRHEKDAYAIHKIRPKISIPLEADIHFNYRLALLSIENGADAVRLNPGNIRQKKEWVKVAHLALKKKIPIRIGLNSGSLFGSNKNVYRLSDKLIARHMVDCATKYMKLLEKEGFYQINISLKASSVLATMQAYRLMAQRCNYPFHLGVTAAGPLDTSLVKSAIGIGGLLSEGIGDTIRVSLTGPPEEEVRVGYNILYALGLANPGIEIISCPTCGRCELNMEKIVRELRRKIAELNTLVYNQRRGLGTEKQTGLKIAVMGCAVNGPGEARDADVGIAGSRGCGVIFRQGKKIRKVKENEMVEALLSEIQKLEVKK